MLQIEQEIHNFFLKNRLTLSGAESCTGGGAAFKLVQIPGASLYFFGSIVAYSNESKQNLLGVKKSTLEKQGAVSKQTAEEMALGALRQFDSDFAFSTTGIAGPGGGSLEKPVGNVWMTIASKEGRMRTVKHQFEGERSQIIFLTIESVFDLLWDEIR